ncbi:molybdenum cofactor biosynthesis protein MoaE [Ferrovum sp. PN-J185]|uniref:molybdenum cofactor biosynthesis protein MoaE n=1 Tax=Ferrovum sp. PN-J185 TaxID=1356306 RepID=UPI00079A0FBB|nr:molybdenum cofactor biosynthesis protein MoaE [Ferrovum sp. PN-J185]KXW56720.1 molybdopterin synthase catalytic subunit [Ferrovum sp. PN-J185]MCC6067595.1 molybdenum cofactor biosynthesis protein MoaE [Ferrovum sp. PN-J185]MDE2056506.1 molybdenum cofactor biosynthesis protein MoaE [Betaproteobacteria bacterium]
MSVRIQTNSFDLGSETQQLRAQYQQVGAVVGFIGTVREQGSQGQLTHLEVEFYPGMTEKSMQDLETHARERWSLIDVLMIHRIGKLAVQEDIVCVVVLSEHRQDAFEAAQFLMDALKSTVPFWKKEIYLNQERWVEAKQSDEQAFLRWKNN